LNFILKRTLKKSKNAMIDYNSIVRIGTTHEPINTFSAVYALSATPLSVTQYFHSFSICMLRTPCGILRTLPTRLAFLLLNLCMRNMPI